MKCCKYKAECCGWCQSKTDVCRRCSRIPELVEALAPEKCIRCDYHLGMSTCARVGGCYKPWKTRLRHFWWAISNPSRKIKLVDP